MIRPLITLAIGLFLNCLTSFASETKRDSLHTFENFATCLYGLKDTNDVVILPAEFTQLREVWFGDTNGVEQWWYYQKGETLGFLDEGGKEMVQFPPGTSIRVGFPYDYFEPYEGYKSINRIVYLDGPEQKGVMSVSQGKTEIKYFDEVMFVDGHQFLPQGELRYTEFIYRDNKEWGVMDSNFRDVIKPTRYKITRSVRGKFYQYEDEHHRWYGLLGSDGKVLVKARSPYVQVFPTPSGKFVIWQFGKKNYTVYNELGEVVASGLALPENGEALPYGDAIPARYKFKSAQGKVGVLSLTGETVLPFQYLEIGKEVPLDSSIVETGLGFVVKGEQGMGVVASGGKELIPLTNQTAYLRGNLIQTYNEPYYAVYNLKAEKLLDSCSALYAAPLLDQNRNLVYTMSRYGRKQVVHTSYTEKEGYLYYLDREGTSLNLCDKNSFRNNGQLLLVNPYKTSGRSSWLVDSTGKIVLAWKGNLYKFPDGYYYRNSREFGRIDKVTGEVTRHPHSYFQVTGSFETPTVITLSGKVGVFNIRKGEWERDTTIYGLGDEVHGVFGTGRWVKTTPPEMAENCCSAVGGWQLLDSNQQSLLPGQYDFPLPLRMHKVNSIHCLEAFVRNGKWGLIHVNGKEIRAPEYDIILRPPVFNGGYLTWKGKMGWITWEGLELEPEWDGVYAAKELTFTWKGGEEERLFSLWDAKLEPIFENKTARQIIQNYDLAALLPEHRFSYGKPARRPDRTIHNRLIIKKLVDQAILDPLDSRLKNGRNWSVKGITRCDRRKNRICEDSIQFKSVRPHSELFWVGEKYISLVEARDSGIASKTYSSFQNFRRSMNTYEITNSGLRQLSKEEVFKDGPEFRDFLFTQMVEQLNREQHNIGSCEDLEAICQKTIYGFLFSEKEVLVYLGEERHSNTVGYSKMVRVPWENIRPFLKI